MVCSLSSQKKKRELKSYLWRIKKRGILPHSASSPALHRNLPLPWPTTSLVRNQASSVQFLIYLLLSLCTMLWIWNSIMFLMEHSNLFQPELQEKLWKSQRRNWYKKFFPPFFYPEPKYGNIKCSRNTLILHFKTSKLYNSLLSTLCSYNVRTHRHCTSQSRMHQQHSKSTKFSTIEFSLLLNAIKNKQTNNV